MGIRKYAALGVVGALALAGAVSGAGAATPKAPRTERVIEWRPDARAQRALVRAATGPSIQTWDLHRTVDGTEYVSRIVGKDPYVRRANATTYVRNPIIPIRLTVEGTNHVYDPTTRDAQCNGNDSALRRLLVSPVYKARQYTLGGTDVGTGQFVDAFQRASFWDATNPAGVNPNYHVTLVPRVLPTLDITLPALEQAAPCGSLAKVDFNAFAYQLLTYLPLFASQGVDSTQFPLFVTKNVVLYQNGDVHDCCILGFHTALANPFDGGLQTVGVAEYDTSGSFRGNTDIAIAVHEIAEWMDDPYVDNLTPPWGHTGQVGGCQADLEVGDPLTGTTIPVTGVNGFTYHPQENAFASWFFGDAPSRGVNGWYSMNGTFTQPAVLCTG